MNLRPVLLSATLIVGALRADGITAARAVAPDARQAAIGDDVRGKALVESSGCFDCHRIDRRGSRVGPDLSDIGTRRTPERLQQALLRILEGTAVPVDGNPFPTDRVLFVGSGAFVGGIVFACKDRDGHGSVNE